MTAGRRPLVLLALFLPFAASAAPADAYEDLFGVHCGGDPDPKGTGLASRIAALEQAQGTVPIGFSTATALALALDEDLQRSVVRDHDAAVAGGEDRHAAFERAVLPYVRFAARGRCHVLPVKDNAVAAEALARALLAEADAPVGEAPEDQIAALLRAWVMYTRALHPQSALARGPAFPDVPWAAADRAELAKGYARVRQASVGKSPEEDADRAAEDWSEANGADRTHRAVEAAVAARLEALWRAIGGGAARPDDWTYDLGGSDAAADALLERAEEVPAVARAARARREASLAAAARGEAARGAAAADRVGTVERAVSVEALLRGRPALGPTDGDVEGTGPVVHAALDAWSASARAAGHARAEAVLQWVRAGLDGARACLGPDSRLQHDKPWACDVGGSPPEITLSWTARDKTLAQEVDRTWIERGVVGEREVPRPPPESKSGLGYDAMTARLDELTARQRWIEEQLVAGVGATERERAEHRLALRREETRIISEGRALLDDVRAWEEWRANPTMKEPIHGDVERQEMQLYARFTAEVTARVRVGEILGPERRLQLPVRARSFSDGWASGVDRVVFDEVARHLDLGALTLGEVRERFVSAAPAAKGPETAAAAFLEQPDAARFSALLGALEADTVARAAGAQRADDGARLAEARAEAEALAARRDADEQAAKAALEASVRDAAARAEAERRAAAEAAAVAAARSEAERRAAAEAAEARRAAEAAAAESRRAAEAAAAESRRAAEARRRPVEVRGVVLAGGEPARGTVLVSACGASTPVGDDGSFSLTVRVEPDAATCEARASRIEPVLLEGPPVSIDVRGERADVRLDLPAAAAGRVGIAAEPADGGLVVVALAPGGPGARAGLRVGDRIVAVDGVPTPGWTTADFVARAIGEPGTSVALTVQGPRGGPKVLVLTREAPPAP